jgi:hypothetical protein
VRLQTLGVTEHTFDIDFGGGRYNWLLYDVGGAVRNFRVYFHRVFLANERITYSVAKYAACVVAPVASYLKHALSPLSCSDTHGCLTSTTVRDRAAVVAFPC